jgi:[NiFe] hydrogenase diaphorase moiety large subunit
MLELVLSRHGRRADMLLQILRELQSALGWLSRATLSQVAAALDLTLAQVQGVAEFYRFLHTRPVGSCRILFSDNVTDRMLGSEALLADLCQRLGVTAGQTREGALVSVDRTSCTGLCDQGPALLINHHQVVTHLDNQRVAQLADLILARVPAAHWPAHWFAVQDNIRRSEVLLGEPLAPGLALAAALERGAEATLGEIKRSKLRGRGGAGFATALKWGLCREAAGAQRFVVCNADEGEPGTFKDRVLLSRFADAVFEGMTVAAHVIGAQRGFLYLASTATCSSPCKRYCSAGARRGCWATRSWGAADLTLILTSTSAPAPTCAGKNRR